MLRPFDIPQMPHKNVVVRTERLCFYPNMVSCRVRKAVCRVGKERVGKEEAARKLRLLLCLNAANVEAKMYMLPGKLGCGRSEWYAGWIIE